MLFFPIINFIINIIKFLYVPLILPFRFRAKIYVYNYFLQSNKYFLIGYKNLKDGKYYSTNGDYFLDKIKLNKFKLFLYFYFVWIWLDDYNCDILNNTKLNSLRLSDFYIKQLTYHNRYCHYNSFIKPMPVKEYNVTSYIYLFYLSLFYSNNNFKNYFYFSSKKRTFMNIGFKQQIFFDSIPMYKFKIL